LIENTWSLRSSGGFGFRPAPSRLPPCGFFFMPALFEKSFQNSSPIRLKSDLIYVYFIQVSKKNPEPLITAPGDYNQTFPPDSS
jgi:hypothetical protein